jgi:hypothetical protein
MSKAAVALSGARPVGRPRKEPPYVPLHRVREMVATAKLDGRWTSWLGIAYMSDMFTREQWEAGLRFAELSEARQRALCSPGCNPRAQDLSAVSGRSVSFETEAQIERHRRALEEWDRIEAGLSKLQSNALDLIVVQMRPAESFVQQMALKDGLNKLVAMWKTPRRKR